MSTSKFVLLLVVTAAGFRASEGERSCISLNDCGENAACVDVPNQVTYGTCACTFGYQADDADTCKPKTTSSEASDAPTTHSPIATTSLLTEHTTVVSSANESESTDRGNEANVTVTSSLVGEEVVTEFIDNRTITPCPGLRRAATAAEAVCLNGGDCVAYNETINYCICKRGFFGERCGNRFTSDKPLDSLVYGSLITKPNHKFVNNVTNEATTVGRNFASSLEDCAHICGDVQPICQSVNFGKYSGGATICEMLAVVANDQYLDYLVLSMDGWTYAYLPYDRSNYER